MRVFYLRPDTTFRPFPPNLAYKDMPSHRSGAQYIDELCRNDQHTLSKQVRRRLWYVLNELFAVSTRFFSFAIWAESFGDVFASERERASCMCIVWTTLTYALQYNLPIQSYATVISRLGKVPHGNDMLAMGCAFCLWYRKHVRNSPISKLLTSRARP